MHLDSQETVVHRFPDRSELRRKLPPCRQNSGAMIREKQIVFKV
jgi:hypothetical protein